MAWGQRSDRGIGRGEVAESAIEAPIFTLLMMVCTVTIVAMHVFLQNDALTIALAISLLVFGTTVVRVEYGLYVLLIAMLLSPEVTAGAVGAHEDRGLNVRYDDILIVVIFLGVLVKHAFEGRPLLWRPNPINAGIFSYFVVCIFSSLLALRLSVQAWDPNLAFFVMLKMFEFYLIFFMVGMAITSMDEIRRQLGVFFAVSLVVCIYGIISIRTQPRVSAPFEAGGTEPNTFGGYLMLIICVALALSFFAPRAKIRWTLWGLAALALMPFLMTLSRASYASIFVSLAVLAITAQRRWLVGALVATLLVAPFVMPVTVVKRVQSTFEPTGVALTVPLTGNEVTIDKSAYERVYVWTKVRHNLRVWPWFGGGVSWGRILDSQFARVIIETGLIGLAAFLFLIWRIISMTRQTYHWSRDWVARGLGLGLFAVTIGFVVHCFGTNTFLIVRIMEPYWFLMALAGVARQIAILDHFRRQQHAREQAIPPATTAAPIHSRA